MTDALERRIAAALTQPVAPRVAAFARRLARREGAVAVLFYGSNLRTGSLDGVLDFYLLLPGPQRERIWPRVGYHEATIDGVELRAKTATMSLRRFADAAAGRRADTTIWARFVQPGALAWVDGAQGDKVTARVVGAVAGAARMAARLAVALGPDRAEPARYWRGLFAQTYRAEFRVERAGREDSILAANAAHFDGLLPLALASAGIDFRWEGAEIAPRMPAPERRRILRGWAWRRRLGKPINLLRLAKATRTFEGAARYAAWKVERHTGTRLAVPPFAERHPLLYAPVALVKVLRARRG